MFTTNSASEFANGLVSGDVLLFSGTDPFDRLVQWADGSHFNHAGIWVGWQAAEDTNDDDAFSLAAAARWTDLTYHAGLNFEMLREDVKNDLLARGRLERHGTLSKVSLGALLGLEGDEVGGGISYQQVTAMRWNDNTNPLNTEALLAHIEARFTADPKPVFDFAHLADYARFWINRAYNVNPPNAYAPKVTLELFELMHGKMEVEANKFIDLYKKVDPGADDGPDRRGTTCSREVYRAFEAAGNPIDVDDGAAHLFSDLVDPAAISDWVTPSDFWRARSLQPIAHYTRPRGI
ncbi:MAG: hypothetical protein AAF467_14305 [Actinomycetota bacterium]